MSDPALWDRCCRVTVYQRPRPGQPATRSTGGLVFEMPTRIRFEVEKTLKASPNTCDITLTNLSPSDREALAKSGLVVQLEAGHASAPRLLFFGDIRYTQSTYAGTDWSTQILAGEHAHAHATSRVNRSYRPGTDIRSVLRDCASGLGLTLPKDLDIDPALSSQFASGFVLEGWARDQLTTLLAPFGYRWSVQNGKLQVLRDNEVRKDLAYVIDDADGMIGSPEIGTPQAGATKRSLVSRVLLYPEIVPGATVKIVSKSIQTIVKAERVKHTGDTHDREWTTEVEATLR